MPSSYPENIPRIVKVIQTLKPARVLDIGPGHGKFGLMTREYRKHGLEQLDGYEVFPPYVKDFNLNSIYDRVFIGNVLDEEEFEPYDLVLIIDVIEHWPKDDAHELLGRLLSTGAKVLVSTPRADLPQDAVNGNVWERHVSDWNSEDYDRYKYVDISNDISFIHILGTDDVEPFLFRF